MKSDVPKHTAADNVLPASQATGSDPHGQFPDIGLTVFSAGLLEVSDLT